MRRFFVLCAALVLGAILLPAVPAHATTYCDGQAVTVTGTSAGETINVPNSPGQVVDALGGDDQVNGSSYADVICGGNGSDTLIGVDGNDREFGQAGTDQLYGETGDDWLEPGPSATGATEVGYGGIGADTFYGYSSTGTDGSDAFLAGYGDYADSMDLTDAGPVEEMYDGYGYDTWVTDFQHSEDLLHRCKDMNNDIGSFQGTPDGPSLDNCLGAN